MNTFSTLNISFLIRKNRTNKHGEAPIYMRISVDQQRVEIATGRYIHPSSWNGKLNKAFPKKKGGVQINQFLDALKNGIYDHHTEMVKNGEDILLLWQMVFLSNPLVQCLVIKIFVPLKFTQRL